MPEKQNTNLLANLWKNYNLSIVLAILFILSWFGQFIFQYFEVINEQANLGHSFKVTEFLASFFQSTFENWQSEFLQLLTMVVLTSFLIHKGSHESKDNDERVEQLLNQMDKRLRTLEMEIRSIADKREN